MGGAEPAMALDTNGRQRWTTERRRKEPSLYDEWLNQERAEKAQHAHSPSALTPTVSGEHPPQHPGDNTSLLRNTSGTIRAVTPDDAIDARRPSQDISHAPERGTSSFERAFLPHLGTTTTIVGGPAASATTTSPSSSSKSRRLLREREWEREARIGQQQQQQQQNSPPPTNRLVTRPAGMLGRSGSRSNGNGHQMPTAQSAREAYQSARPRTRTLDESRRRERSPNSVMKSRNRMGLSLIHI